MASHHKATSLIKMVSIVLIFFIFVAVLVVANLLASLEEDPYLSFFERLQPGFYYKTLLIVLFSSLLYTPLSYGITNFILQSTRREARLADLFYLFTKPILLIKAIMLRVTIWLVRGFYQLIVLFVGVVLETLICLLHFAFAGENIMNLSTGELPRLIFETREHNSLMWLTVILWVCILIVIVITYFFFMLCKYALFRYEELSVFESIGIGRLAVRGRFFVLCFRLLQNYSYYILLIGSFGLLGRMLRVHKKEPFSLLALRWVEQGRILYFEKKGRKPLDK